MLALTAISGSMAATAQKANPGYTVDSQLSRWVIDVNLIGGLASQDFKTANSNLYYPGGVNLNTGELKYKNGYALGADAQLGFFFGKKRHFGLGAGFMYMQQSGNNSLNGYHVEYEAKDAAGNIYRQVVNGRNISEDIVATNLNVPVVLKYKNRFSKHWGFAADLGAVINVRMENAYTTKASFNYEAIYQLQKTGDAGTVSVYDNAPTPSGNDWFITSDEFLQNNKNGNVDDYFAKKRALGYSVGEGMTPTRKTGQTSFTTPSVGFMIQPSFNYFLSDKVALNLGLFYMFQPFKNEAKPDYRLTQSIGSYSGTMNNVTASNNQVYGLNIGARFFLCKKSEPLRIASADMIAPTQCGVCDGSIALHGLTPEKSVTVTYNKNGMPQPPIVTVVANDSIVKIPNLCAANYTEITATVKRKSATVKPMAIADPKLVIAAQTAGNPTVIGACDGSVKLDGLYAGKTTTVVYDRDGITQAPYTAVAGADRSIAITGLCEGRYSNVLITCNTCSVKGADFVLAAPKPIVITIEPGKTNNTDVNGTTLFDFDKSIINPAYYPELDDAVKEMKEDEYIYIQVDGYADKIGTEEYNQKLSERRAQAIKDYLTARGVKAQRIKIYGHGETEPAATNSTRSGRSQNRRAIIGVGK